MSYEEQNQDRIAPSTGIQPFLYPAFAALPFLPLSFLSWRAAYILFLGVNVFLLWISARLLRGSLTHLSALWEFLPLALFFCFFPAGEVIMQDQISILLLTLYCAAFYSLQKGRPFCAGLFAGLAIIKIQTALPVVLLFLLWRRWRFVAGFLVTASAALAASLWITGSAVFVQYWRSLFLMAASYSGITPHFNIPPHMMVNLFGLAHLLSGGASWGTWMAKAASLPLLLLVASRRGSLPMALVAALLVSRYLGIHDLVLLLLPISVALNHAVANPQELRSRAAMLVCLILLLPPVYLFLLGAHHLSLLALALLALLFCLPGLKTAAPASST